MGRYVMMKVVHYESRHHLGLWTPFWWMYNLVGCSRVEVASWNGKLSRGARGGSYPAEGYLQYRAKGELSYTNHFKI